METALGPKTVASSPRNGPELAKIVSVDDRHVNAPWGSSIVEINSGSQNYVEMGQNRLKLRVLTTNT